jgi:hypothetical protein
LILALAMTRRMKVTVPLCQAHRRHWLGKNVVGIVGLVLLLAIGTLGIIILRQVNMPRDTADRLGGILCGGTFFALFLWLVVMIILEARLMKAAEISERGITLRGLSPLFLQALWEQRLERRAELIDEEEEEELPPVPRRPQAGEFFDPNAARRRHLPPEDVEGNDS